MDNKLSLTANVDEQFEASESFQPKTVYNAESGRQLKTSLSSVAETQYLDSIEHGKEVMDNYVGMIKTESDRPSIFGAAMEKTAYIGKAVASGVTSAVGTTYRWGVNEFARQIAQSKSKESVLFGGDVSVEDLKTGDVFTHKMNEEIESKYNEVVESIRFDSDQLKNDQLEFINEVGLSRPEDAGHLWNLGEGAGSLVFAMGASVLTGSSAAAGVLFGGMSKQSAYEEMLEGGIEDEGYLQKVSTVNGVLQGVMEKAGLKALDDIIHAGKGFARIGAAAAAEGIQEMSQGISEEVIMQQFGGREKDIYSTLKEIGYAGLMGAILGGGAAGVGGAIQKGSQELQAQGVDETTANAMSEKTILAALSNPQTSQELQNTLIQMNSSLQYPNGNIDTAKTQYNEARTKAYEETAKEKAAFKTAVDKYKTQSIGIDKAVQSKSIDLMSAYASSMAEKLNTSRIQVLDDMNITINGTIADMINYDNVQKYAQGERGQFDPNTKVIDLFETADSSTLVHELTHGFTEHQAKFAPELLSEAMNAYGYKGKALNDLSPKEYVDFHEKVSNGMEAYLREGKAPSAKLKQAFEMFRDWLRTIYKSAEQMKVQISPEMRAYYDNILTTEDDIKAEIEDSIIDIKKPLLNQGMVEEEADALIEQIKNIKNPTAKDLQAIKELLEGKVDLSTSQVSDVVAAIKEGGLVVLDPKAIDKAYDIVKDAANIKSNTDLEKMRAKLSKELNKLNISTDKKNMFLNHINQATTQLQMTNIAKEIAYRTETLVNEYQRRKAQSKIRNTLKKYKNIIQGGVSKGRYDVDTNNFFKAIKEVHGMSIEEAKLELIKYETDEYSVKTEYQGAYERFLNYKIKGSKVSAELANQVAEDLDSIIDEGRRKRDVAKLESIMQKREDLKGAKSSIDRFKKQPGYIRKKFINWVGDLELMLDDMFGKEFSDKWNLINKEKKQQVAVYNKTEEIHDSVGSIYQLENKAQNAAKLSELKTKNEDYKLSLKSDPTMPQTLSKMDLITINESMKNPSIKERYNDSYGEAQLNNLLSNLTAQDLAFGSKLSGMVQSYYAKLNEVYVKLYNKDLNRVKEYFPTSSEYSREGDIFNDYMTPGTTPGQFKSRAVGLTTPIVKDAYDVVNSYIAQAEYILNTGLKHKALTELMKDAEIKRRIVAKYGDNGYKTLEHQLQESSLSAFNKRYNEVGKAYNKLLSNIVAAKIIANPSSGSKQTISSINFMTQMPAGTWSKGVAKAVANPVKTIKFMLENSDYLKMRFQQGGSHMEQMMIKEAESMSSKTKQKLVEKGAYFPLRKWLSFMNRGGDIAAFVFGGKPLIDHYMSQGMTQAEAFDKFEDVGLRSQQSGLASQMSSIQKSDYRVLTMFKNSIMQYGREMYKASVEHARGEISSGEFAKKMSIYGVVNPSLFGMASYFWGTGLWNLIAGDEPSEDESMVRDMMYQIMVSPMNAVPILGSIIDAGTRQAMYGYSFDQSVPVIADSVKGVKAIIHSVKEGEISLKDWEKISTSIGEVGLGLPVGTAYRYGKKSGIIEK